MGKNMEEWTKSNLWTTAFKKFETVWCILNRLYQFKFTEGSHPRFFLNSFLNALSRFYLKRNRVVMTVESLKKLLKRSL